MTRSYSGIGAQERYEPEEFRAGPLTPLDGAGGLELIDSGTSLKAGASYSAVRRPVGGLTFAMQRQGKVGCLLGNEIVIKDAGTAVQDIFQYKP
jgi:hypothetical protein